MSNGGPGVSSSEGADTKAFEHATPALSERCYNQSKPRAHEQELLVWSG